MAKLILFVSKGCPHCPKAAAVVMRIAREYEEDGLSYEKVRTRTERGKRLSVRFNVNVFPTLLMFDGDGRLRAKISGVPSEDVLKKKVELLLGLRKPLLSRFIPWRH
ncbi:thioredoxin family protein [Candidatus Woesearchaeota archaeon]|nr:thioredoxin family protein [Candidatus Woesearchaeota archaeon]